MDLDQLQRLAPTGQTLNLEERAGLKVGFAQREREENLPTRLQFWGKIMGVENDYLVATHLLPTDTFPVKKYYYCTSGDFVLRQLPELNEEYTRLASAITGRFKGDPSLPLDGKGDDEPVEADADSESPPKEVERFRELHRLSFAVRSIDHDCSVVPQGALLVDAAHKIMPSASFAGLSYASASEKRAYYHFRRPENAQSVAVLERPGLVRVTDALDCITRDRPDSVWQVNISSDGDSSLVRNAYWPGYAFLHVINSGVYGGVYMGYGLPNRDIAFM